MMLRPIALEGYTNRSELGAGRSTDVFRYEHDWSHQQVAVHVWRSRLTTSIAQEAFREFSERVIRLSAHPSIVSVQFAGIADDHPYVVTDYCAAAALSKRTGGRPVDISAAVSWMIEISGALATAHAAGLAHGNIHAGNVLFVDNERPALADFALPGLSRDVSRSVEGAASSPSDTARADVMALTVLTMQLMGGNLPKSALSTLVNSAADRTAKVAAWAMCKPRLEGLPAPFLRVFEAALNVGEHPASVSAEQFGHGLQAGAAALHMPKTTLVVDTAILVELANFDDATALGRPNAEIVPKDMPHDETVSVPNFRDATVIRRPGGDATVKGRPSDDATMIGWPTDVSPTPTPPSHESSQWHGSPHDEWAEGPAAPERFATNTKYEIRRIPVPQVAPRATPAAQPEPRRVDTMSAAANAGRRRIAWIAALLGGCGILAIAGIWLIVWLLH